ncbi:DUF2891 domain-containing protein [Chitinophaga filiformis]|uniref:DUF2891 domain-containing protein n=1 Tax=Chitinophaga filiformis TaxID=104663 RepID=UPI001F1AAC3D|nr:DUF2891 domain-containing protein [Chitinophaga filiformis]MCF6401964.1 DUF2891 domain-containing protein [Chitinophaga filiformis]
MKKTFILISLITGSLMPTASAQQAFYTRKSNGLLDLTPAGATHLAELPLRCMQQEFPYKTGIVFSDTSLVTAPKAYHPAFYGCFDWHSSVHGHWMLVRLLKSFPDLSKKQEIVTKLSQNLTAANIAQEQRLFQNKENKSFERIYGWSWLLQLQRELLTWNDPLGKQLAANVQPLATQFSKAYIDFLGKLVYPIRVGEHTNLAFGLSLAWDYAATANDTALQQAIRQAAMRFYAADKNCPAAWEPGGYDFLSPCLEEADLMWRILPAKEYQTWVKAFLPELFARDVTVFKVAQVKDITDGKLVHLHGLNLSRAWCLYGIARHVTENRAAILQLANLHLESAIPHVASGNYAGEHWLASFAVYALTTENN